jgi:hypothetical protein
LNTQGLRKVFTTQKLVRENMLIRVLKKRKKFKIPFYNLNLLEVTIVAPFKIRGIFFGLKIKGGL